MDLKIIRKTLDSIDSKLIGLIATRQSYMVRVARYKKMHRLPINQPKREQEILRLRKAQAKKKQLDPILVEKIWRELFKNAKAVQRRIK